MALLLKKLYEAYMYAMNDLADPRTQSLPLVKSVFMPFGLVALYCIFVLKIGPEFMKNRKPFNLDKLMIVYNALQVIYCTGIVIEGLRVVISKYSWRCEPVDYSNSKEALYITRLFWSYYMIKILDLLDTLFFVLRKKDTQISFLHVYHHGGMVLLSWGTTKWLPGGHGAYVGIVNCFVHAIMYSYYLLTAYNKEYKKSIWWKKHITQLQLFTLFSFLYGQLVFRDCGFPRATMIVFLPQNLFMMCLFAEFYYKTYIRKKAKIAPINNQNGFKPRNGSVTQKEVKAN